MLELKENFGWLSLPKSASLLVSFWARLNNWRLCFKFLYPSLMCEAIAAFSCLSKSRRVILESFSVPHICFNASPTQKSVIKTSKISSFLVTIFFYLFQLKWSSMKIIRNLKFINNKKNWNHENFLLVFWMIEFVEIMFIETLYFKSKKKKGTESLYFMFLLHN